MPRIEGLSGTTTTCWWCRSPSAASVRRMVSACPIPERTCFTRRPPLAVSAGRVAAWYAGPWRPTTGLRPISDLSLPGPVPERGDLDLAFARHLAHRHQALEPGHRGPDHVVRVVAAQALGQDVRHPGALEHRADRAAGDDAGAGRGRLEQDPARPVLAEHVVGDRGPGAGHLDHGALGRLDRLADGLGDLVRLAGGHPHAALAVADGDEGVEGEPAAALHDLG